MATTNMIFLLLSSAFSLALNAQKIRNSEISFASSLSTISGNNSWLSPSGQFAFGFYPEGDGFAIGIWFENTPEKTLIWSFFTSYVEKQLLKVSSNATLLFDNEGWLVLRENFQGQQYRIIGSGVYGRAASASMLDSGNFVLYNSSSGIVWQSFDSPTNTILQGQHLSNGAELFSSASETDHSKGRFRLKMQNDGNLVQYPEETPDTAPYSYFSSFTDGNGPSVKLYLEDNGHLCLINGTGIKIKNLTNGSDNSTGKTPVFYRMTLDVDGIFRVYSQNLNQKNGTWSIEWSSTDDKCAPKGFCGVNSFCDLMDQVAECHCVPGFSFIDQGNNTLSLGCERNSTVNCGDDKKITMSALENYSWEDDAYSSFLSTREDCRKACLDDCNCQVVRFNGQECSKQKLPLRYGRRSIDEATTTFIKINVIQGPTNQSHQGKGSETTKQGHSNGRMKIAIAASFAGTLVVFTGIAILYYLRRRGLTEHSIQCCLRRKRTRDGQRLKLKDLIRDHGTLATKIFKYSDLKKITNSFRDKLGQGGYGSVFKGKLPDGRMVAVKILSETKGNGEEFINEVASISRISHVNIVPLLGFCIQGSKRALVYEFMPNGSLEKFIFIKGVSSKANILELDALYKIVVGIARGLEYLHRGCHTRIVHFDIKPHNILLDQDFCPKISDFGLAKLCFKKDSIVSIKGTRGTIGYIAPELVSRNFGVSHKSDVYSYGMMVLEMVGGRKNIDVEANNTSEIYFPLWIYKQLETCEDLGLCRAETKEEREIARKMTLVGLWCIQTNPANRPSMNEVLVMLEGRAEDLQIPPNPNLSSPSVPKQASSTSSIS